MALRVLLADESSTIKKAIQMVLSDYGVEVKMVPTGIDVFSVTQQFNPDIVLIDVLLTKKNGYEVCAELKKNPATKNIPVILMWSNFMQIDQAAYKQCKADATLEKPFDTETVRTLVESLVPKLQTFPLKGLLNHPQLPDFEESDTFVRQKNDFATLAQQAPKASSSSGLQAKESWMEPKIAPSVENPDTFSLDDDNEVLIDTDVTRAIASPVASSGEADSYSQVDLTPTGKGLPNESDEWAPAKTSQFVIETENFGDFEEVKVINSNESEERPSLKKKITEQIQDYLQDAPVASHKANALQQKQNFSSFDEQLLREEIRQVAERICWQVIPEVTEKIVREELNKLLQGIENNV